MGTFGDIPVRYFGGQMDGWMDGKGKKKNLKVEKRTGKFFWMPI
jgi:hypothetical protein